MFNLALPHYCVLCGFAISAHSTSPVVSQKICGACFDDLPIQRSSCKQCAQTIPSNNVGHSLCGSCLREPPPFDYCHALFPYAFPISQLIIKLKFGSELRYAALFAELMLQQIKERWYAHQPLPDLILPMPLHTERLKTRGFNQAVEIAKPIAQTLGIPLVLDGVIRQKMTRSQSGLDAHMRAENVAHAFIHTRSYANLHIAILDDVVTTGQTIAACSQALRAAKAKRIDIWCCARRS